MTEQIFAIYSKTTNGRFLCDVINKAFSDVEKAFGKVVKELSKFAERIGLCCKKSKIVATESPNPCRFYSSCIAVPSINIKTIKTNNNFKIGYYRRINDSRSGMKGKAIRRRLGK